VKKQTTRDFVPIARQYEFFHALPPLAEQRRIVAKVDELIQLCDQLETLLAKAQVETSRLLESVLHYALITPEPFSNVTYPARQGETHA
jgi:type I restriction enzyme S subunit